MTTKTTTPKHARYMESHPGKCVWTAREDACYFETKCGEAFTFIDGTPAENHYSFCPNCGKPIEVVK
jgi:hypothetical protein